MSEALIPLESVNAVEVFTGGGLDDLLARNRAAMAALIAQGISEDDAATVITAIVQGKVPAVAIRY